jgi:branched-chain amino acid transport system substrate-binding protein
MREWFPLGRSVAEDRGARGPSRPYARPSATQKRKRSRVALSGLACVSLLGMAACGGSSTGTSSGTTSGGTTSGGTTGGSTATTTKVSSAAGSGALSGPLAMSVPSTVAETGKKANPALSPVLVGFHNLEGGAISLPEVRIGFQEGMKYVNEQLGGINGHTMTAYTCNTDTTPETTVNCANQFVQKNVVMAVQGVDVNGDAALPILKAASIVDVGIVAFSPEADVAGSDEYAMLFSNEEGFAAGLIADQKEGAKTVAVVQADLPSAHADYTRVVVPVAKKVGVKVRAFYYPTTADWTSLAATILADSPDAVDFPAAEDSVCLSAIPALRSAGFSGTIHASSCSEISQLPYSELKNVINHNEFYYPTMTSIPPKPKSDLSIYLSYMKRDDPTFQSLVYTQLGFFIAVEAASVLTQVKGPVTAKSVTATIPHASGPKFFTTTDYNCATPTWPGTSACGSGEIFTTWTPNKLKSVLPFSPIDVSGVKPSGS